MKKDNLFIIVILVSILIPVILAIPQTLNLHGKLTDDDGDILSGNYNMTFNIYDVSTGGSSLWNATNQTISVGSDGIYHFILTGVNLTFAEQYYLGITVRSDSEMTPRINLTSTPYSFRTNITDNLNSANNYEMQNLTLGQKITFALGGIIDNIINGVVRITGGLNVTGTSYFKNASFNGGWLNDGVSIIDGDIYAQVGYFYNITSLNVTRQNLTVIDDLIVQGNVGIGTTSPKDLLHLYRGALRLEAQASVGFEAIKFYEDTAKVFDIEYNGAGAGSTGNFLEFNSAWAPNILVLRGDGNVGIGAPSPSQKLHVEGNVNITGNLTLGLGSISFNDSSKRYIYYNGSIWKDMSMGNVPAGAIMAFNSATCPTGWILADGNSETPDLRGIFIRGAGANEVLNGTLYNATYGEYQNDSTNSVYSFQTSAGSASTGDKVIPEDGSYTPYGYTSGDGAGDYWRIRMRKKGIETAPASFALIYCMKTTEDSETSNTIWGESGNDIVPNNSSKNVHLYEDLTVDGNVNITGNLTRPCPTGFTSIENKGNQLGCMQTAEEGSGSWEVASDDCFDTYGGRLPTTGEMYISFANFVLTDEDEDWERCDDYAYYNSVDQHAVMDGPTSQSVLEDATSVAYRCWLPR